MSPVATRLGKQGYGFGVGSNSPEIGTLDRDRERRDQWMKTACKPSQCGMEADGFEVKCAFEIEVALNQW